MDHNYLHLYLYRFFHNILCRLEVQKKNDLKFLRCVKEVDWFSYITLTTFRNLTQTLFPKKILVCVLVID